MRSWKQYRKILKSCMEIFYNLYGLVPSGALSGKMLAETETHTIYLSAQSLRQPVPLRQGMVFEEAQCLIG